MSEDGGEKRTRTQPQASTCLTYEDDERPGEKTVKGGHGVGQRAEKTVTGE